MIITVNIIKQQMIPVKFRTELKKNCFLSLVNGQSSVGVSIKIFNLYKVNS